MDGSIPVSTGHGPYVLQEISWTSQEENGSDAGQHQAKECHGQDANPVDVRNLAFARTMVT